jgi:hypothetical protein
MNQQLRAELSGIELSEQQLETVERAMLFVAPRDCVRFLHKLASRLRGIRELKSSDVAHHCSAALADMRKQGCGEAYRERPNVR